MRPAFAASFLLCLLLGVRGPAATVQQYDRALAQVQDSLSSRIPQLEAREVPTGPPPPFVARRVLMPIHTVGPPGAAPQPVDNRLLLQALTEADRKGDIGKMSALAQQIGTLRASLGERPVTSRAALRGERDPLADARAVLARPEFGSEPFPPPPISERIADWIDAQLRKIKWPSAPKAGPNVNLPTVSPAFIQGLLVLLAAGAVAILVAVLVQALSRRQARGRAAPLLDDTEAALVEARDTDSLFALAERQAQEGDYRRAFRLVYIATLVSLDTGGVLRFDRSKTNWEYLRALRAAGRDDVYGAMMPLTREFDRIWYGFAHAGPGEYARAVAQYRGLQAVPQAA